MATPNLNRGKEPPSRCPSTETYYSTEHNSPITLSSSDAPHCRLLQLLPGSTLGTVFIVHSHGPDLQAVLQSGHHV